MSSSWYQSKTVAASCHDGSMCVLLDNEIAFTTSSVICMATVRPGLAIVAAETMHSIMITKAL